MTRRRRLCGKWAISIDSRRLNLYPSLSFVWPGPIGRCRANYVVEYCSGVLRPFSTIIVGKAQVVS